jgi:hypothetical protein
MICLWLGCPGRPKECCGGGDWSILLHGDGERGGSAGCGVLLEAVRLAGARFGEGAGQGSERDD